MNHKIINFPTFISWFRKSRRDFSRIPVLIWLNFLTIICLGLLSIYAEVRSKGQGIENLFSDPFEASVFYFGWLTSISEIMWCVAIAICGFTTALLPRADYRFRVFLSFSALLMALLYFDDRFRLTLILCTFFGAYRVVKTTVYLVYGSFLIIYARAFRQTIKKTPYVPLLIAFCLFAFSSAIDITPLGSRGIHAMLEDGTKLIGLINLTVYFWYICQRKIAHKIRA
ncbi:hypothetical protein [Myxosarcina sp. GI1]|uniref:hypothetical protein n=1 Tax=Myxosarcina sp. GI1 TaxID=1541065 RepID=UPI0005654E4A|nr:hypothetical protein [Myxosarcina sp. GI1]